VIATLPRSGFSLAGTSGRKDLSRGLRCQERLGPLRGQSGGEGAQRVARRRRGGGGLVILACLSEKSLSVEEFIGEFVATLPMSGPRGELGRARSRLGNTLADDRRS
jgi:hypothetical protein